MNLPSFPKVDLFSAGINALNGVLVARDPSHNRGYSLAGLLIKISRDTPTPMPPKKAMISNPAKL